MGQPGQTFIGMIFCGQPLSLQSGECMTRKLTDKQRKFRDNVLAGMSLTKAAEHAGYSCAPQAGYTLMRSAAVRNSIISARESQIIGDLGTIAVHTMRDLMKEGPAAQRYQAAAWVLKAGGIGGDRDPGDPAERKALEDMDASELADAVKAGMGALSELAVQLQDAALIDGQFLQLKDIPAAELPENAETDLSFLE